MNVFPTALRVAARTFVAGRAALASSVLFVGGLVALTLAFAVAARAGDDVLLARLGPLAGGEPWEVIAGSAVQIAAAAGVLASGVVLAWSFGREFTEGTVAGLFAQPVGRSTIALAKIVVHLVWSGVLGVVTAAVVALAALAAGFGTPDADSALTLARLPVLVFWCGFITLPAALFATVGRGLLAGLAAVVIILVVTQVSVVTGAGPWFPLAAPALWAIDPGAVPAVAWALAPVVPAAAVSLTLWSWHRLQLDR